MEIKTKFNLGDKVFVLKASKAVEMEIKSIAVDKDGAYYSDGCAGYIFQPVPEAQCFASVEELVKYITSE